MRVSWRFPGFGMFQIFISAKSKLSRTTSGAKKSELKSKLSTGIDVDSAREILSSTTSSSSTTFASPATTPDVAPTKTPAESFAVQISSMTVEVNHLVSML